MTVEFYFTPELHLRDGRIIRHLEDAVDFAREQELRPGVDQRDEILHALERARKRTRPRTSSFAGWKSWKSWPSDRAEATGPEVAARRRRRGGRPEAAQA